MNREQAADILTLLCQAIVDTVRECPDGAPNGIVYAAVAAHGLSLDTYTQVLELCKRSGYLTQRGDLLYATRGS